MRRSSKFALLMAASITLPVLARAEPDGASRMQLAAPEHNPLKIEACASDPLKLGLSRVVEIDTTGGPEFGGSHNGTTGFLQDKEVVLTFDDGPLRPYTRPVLKALAAHCTKATFFMVGRMAAADPAMVKEVAAAGHTVASHTWSHKNLTPISFIKSRQEFEGGISAVTKANGAPIAPFFRFPYLAHNRHVTAQAKARGISTFWIDIDSKDFRTRDPKEVHRRVMSQLIAQRKGIILMHDIQPSTAGAIMNLLDDLRAKGFKVVHVVPKGQAATVASFDAEASEQLKAVEAKKQASPLASRSMVWTMASPGSVGAAAGAAKAQPHAKPVARAVAPASEPAEVLPWATKTAPAAVEPAPPPAPAPRPARKPARREELPWQSSIFGF